MMPPGGGDTVFGVNGPHWMWHRWVAADESETIVHSASNLTAPGGEKQSWRSADLSLTITEHFAHYLFDRKIKEHSCGTLSRSVNSYQRTDRYRTVNASVCILSTSALFFWRVFFFCDCAPLPRLTLSRKKKIKSFIEATWCLIDATLGRVSQEMNVNQQPCTYNEKTSEKCNFQKPFPPIWAIIEWTAGPCALALSRMVTFGIG